MRIPTIRGIIDRRILVNYRVDPSVLAKVVPAPFRPKLLRGCGMAGICLIRLRGVRPVFWPKWLGGIGSENAAHRTAVQWDEAGAVREGVYIRRRDSSSRLNALVGGRLFPGVHHHARFDVEESAGAYSLALQSDDWAVHLSVKGRVASCLPPTSLFESMDEASAFFAAGSLGYSATIDPRRFQGLELRCQKWRVEALSIDSVASSFFDDPNLFPPGSAEFDCALLMRNIEHEWLGRPDLCCDENRILMEPEA